MKPQLDVEFVKMRTDFSADVGEGEDHGLVVDVIGKWKWPRVHPKSFAGMNESELAKAIIDDLVRDSKFLLEAKEHGVSTDPVRLKKQIVDWQIEDGAAVFVIVRW